MNIKQAFSNGAHFGGTVGIMIGAAALIGSGAGVLAIMPWLCGYTLAGAAVGGTFFAAAHAITHTIPGLSYIMGEPRSGGPAAISPAASQKVGRSAYAGSGKQSTRLDGSGDFELTESRNSYEDMIEAQREAQQQMEIGR